MHILYASCLLIVCGIVDATFHNQRGQLFNQLIPGRPTPLRFMRLPRPQKYRPIPMPFYVHDSNIYATKHWRETIPTVDTNTLIFSRVHNTPELHFDFTPVTPKLIPENSLKQNYDHSLLNSLSEEFKKFPDIFPTEKASNLNYKFPTYESALNFTYEKIFNNFFRNIKPVKTNPKILIKKPIFINNESNYALETSTRDELNFMVLNKNPIENQLDSITTERDWNSIFSDKNPTEKQSYSTTTEDESNFITTENESNSIKIENESNSIPTEDESNSITTEENQSVHDDYSWTPTMQEIISSELVDALNVDWSMKSSEYHTSNEMEISQRYQKLKELMKPYGFHKHVMTDINSAEVPSNLASDENEQLTNQQLELQLPVIAETETSDEYV